MPGIDALPPMRRIACSQCGAEFGCQNKGPAGSCWCSAEDFRLPVPLPDEFAAIADCLCPDCLRNMAAELKRRGYGPAEARK